MAGDRPNENTPVAIVGGYAVSHGRGERSGAETTVDIKSGRCIAREPCSVDGDARCPRAKRYDSKPNPAGIVEARIRYGESLRRCGFRAEIETVVCRAANDAIINRQRLPTIE